MNGPPQKPMTAWSGRARHGRAGRPRGRTAPTPPGPARVSRSTSAEVSIGSRDDRADALDELDVDPHPEDREHDVREHHGRVDAVAPDRLQGHLGAELGLPADLEEGVALADLAVLRQRAAGLAHEPDRRALDVLAPARAHEKRLGHAPND